MKKRTICIDFDGVIHDYSGGFQGKDVFGNMIPNADKCTQLLHKKDWTIIIYTTRPKTAKLEAWLKDHKIAYDYINENPDQPEDSKSGKLVADIYLDDRAICFGGRWDGWLMSRIAGFKPWEEEQDEDIWQQYENAAKRLAETNKKGPGALKGAAQNDITTD